MTQEKGTFYKWADLPQTELAPKIRRRIISGKKIMSVEFALDKGAVIAEHAHPHEQISHVISGALEFNMGGAKQVVSSGGVVVIPSNVPHSVVAMEDTINIEIFSPPREDFLTGESPDYMQS